MMALWDRSTCSKTGTWGAKVWTRRPKPWALVRNRVIRVPRLENVNWHTVPVSDLLPADEEIGQEGNGIGHVPVLKGVEGTGVGLLPLNIPTRLAEQCDPNHMWRKKLFLCLTPGTASMKRRIAAGMGWLTLGSVVLAVAP